MVRETMQIGVFVERRKLKNPWIDHAWIPDAVLAGAPAAEPWTVIDDTPKGTRFYAGAFELVLFSTHTDGYRHNLHSGQPSLWVSLRAADTDPGVTLHIVTADPMEGEALTEPGTDIVEAVPMPPAIQARITAFVEAHHIERPFVKRKRDRADPEAMATRRPGFPKPGGKE